MMRHCDNCDKDFDTHETPDAPKPGGQPGPL